MAGTGHVRSPAPGVGGCCHVLTQVSAVTKALQAVAVGLLDEHVRHCVKNAIADGDTDAIETMVAEATKAIERLVKA